jgi:hypothetical protein
MQRSVPASRTRKEGARGRTASKLADFVVLQVQLFIIIIIILYSIELYNELMRVLGLEYRDSRRNHRIHLSNIHTLAFDPPFLLINWSPSCSICLTHHGSYRKYPHIPDASARVIQLEKSLINRLSIWLWKVVWR